MKNIIIPVLLILTIIISGCGSDNYYDFPNYSSDELKEDSVIEEYYIKHFPVNIKNESNDDVRIYIDLSSGITESSFSVENNKELVRNILGQMTNVKNVDYFELRDDSIKKYYGNEYTKYFTYSAFHENGKYKDPGGAPIDKALEQIVDNDDVGILVTDGELINRKTNEVSEEYWASESFRKWFNKGHEIVFVYSDFEDETNKQGLPFKKHMYLMFFIPNNDKEILNNYLESIQVLSFKTLNFSTNTSNLYRRDYQNDALPGMSKYIEYFESPSSYKKSEIFPYEFIDITDAEFSLFQESGLVYFLRDLGDENTGKPMSYPILEKLYFNFSSLPNYKVENLKIVVHDVYDDFKNYKRNILARKYLPEVEKSLETGQDSLNDANYMVFKGMPTVDDEEPYDTSKVTVLDTVNNYVSILKPDFKFNKKVFDYSDKGISDFLELDQSAGKVSEINEDGEYEVVIKFSKKLNENNPNLNTLRNNLFRIDIVMEDVSLKELDKNALTWQIMIGNRKGKKDVTLYSSLKSIMNTDGVKPSGVIYSFFLKTGPFTTD